MHGETEACGIHERLAGGPNKSKRNKVSLTQNVALLQIKNLQVLYDPSSFCVYCTMLSNLFIIVWCILQIYYFHSNNAC